MVSLQRQHLDAIRSHAERDYPDECCGVLVGRLEEGYTVRRVDQSLAVKNIHPGHKNDRFTLDPKEFLSIEKKARERSLSVVGFYHSHPDHPARPSGTDAEWAHPVYSYVIVSVRGGRSAELTAWEFRDGEFVEESIEEVG
ncbi:MAG: M67 family metallopeptidase [Armatimonadetes bacterium]|nr:M67 family metallopeptidase [Armatimonadota bacterium]